ncbi:MAG: PAS domain S-box protein [Candidatus Margulisiibacteriota bacterium]
MTFNPYSAVYLFSAVISFCLILLLWFRGTRSKEQLYFLAFCFSVFLWNGSAFLGVNSTSVNAAVLFAKLACLGIILIPASFSLFISTFLMKERNLYWKAQNNIFLGLTIIFAVLDLTTGLFVSGVVAKGHFAYFTVPGILFVPLTLIVYYSAILGNVWLVLDIRNHRGHKLQQIKFLLLAFGAGFIGGLLTIAAMFTGIPVTELSGLAVVPYVLITAYAILRYRLMDVSLILKKTTAYSLITTGITFVYVLVVLGFEYLFRFWFGYFSFWAALPAALIVTLTFMPLRRLLQAGTDRIFFQQVIEYQRIIREVTNRLASITDLETLFRMIDMTVAKILCVGGVAVLLHEEKRHCYVVEKINSLPKEFTGLQISEDDPLIVLLRTEKSAILIEELKNRLAGTRIDRPDREMAAAAILAMEKFKAAVAVPSFIKEDLTGVLLLGEKLSEETYNDDDLELLATMAAEAGIAIENAKLYRDIMETRDYLNSIIKGSDDAIFTIDLEGKVQTWNEAAERILGYPAAEVIGQQLPFVSREETAGWIAKIKAGENLKNLEVTRQNKAGRALCLLVTISPIKAGTDEVIGLSAIANDITERKRSEDKLREQMKELQEWHQVTVGREMKMIELEKEVDALLTELHRTPKYQ